jgi:hypothetical protein
MRRFAAGVKGDVAFIRSMALAVLKSGYAETTAYRTVPRGRIMNGPNIRPWSFFNSGLFSTAR